MWKRYVRKLAQLGLSLSNQDSRLPSKFSRVLSLNEGCIGLNKNGVVVFSALILSHLVINVFAILL